MNLPARMLRRQHITAPLLRSPVGSLRNGLLSSQVLAVCVWDWA